MLNRDHSGGYTLVELLVVVALISIITAASAASFSSIISSTQIRTTARKLHQGLALARTAAIYRSRLITVCPLSSNNKCSKDWSKPVSVFVDSEDARALRRPQDLIEVIPHAQPIRLQVKPSRKRYFQFTPSGMVHGTLGSVLLCGGEKGIDQAVYMSVNMGGRVRELWDKNGDGKIRTSYGSTYSCTNSS